MSADLKECPFCGSPAKLIDHRTIFSVECASATCAALALGDRAPEPDGEMGDAYWAAYQQTAIDRWNARAIAPPVAAGSVDTEELRILLRARENTPHQSHPALIAHIAAWGSQQREAGYHEGVEQLRHERDSLLVLANEQKERAEKAEAEITTVKALVLRFWTGQYFDGVTKGDAAEINEALK